MAVKYSNYILITATESSAIVSQVNTKMDQGYSLLGGISTATLSDGKIQYTQAMAMMTQVVG